MNSIFLITLGKFIIPKDHKESEARGRLVPKGRHYVAMRCFNDQEKNNGLVMHIQTEVVSPKVSAYMLLIRRFMAEPFFSELRTQQQLGERTPTPTTKLLILLLILIQLLLLLLLLLIILLPLLILSPLSYDNDRIHCFTRRKRSWAQLR
jgi:hypothetical protein